MNLSRERILTTHVGSLPRPQNVVDALFAPDRGESIEQATFDETMRQAVAVAVAKQVAAGVDIVSDGEKPMAYLIEAANPRHAHEWALWREAPLPADKVLIPGVLDGTTNFIEHPELVSERICRYADAVGRERVIAGTDCGFGTFAGFGAVHPTIAYAKLQAMADGARIASEPLWS